MSSRLYRRQLGVEQAEPIGYSPLADRAHAEAASDLLRQRITRADARRAGRSIQDTERYYASLWHRP